MSTQVAGLRTPAVDLDLSAFETPSVYADTTAFNRPGQHLARPTAIVRGGAGRPDASPSKRAQQRQAERQAELEKRRKPGSLPVQKTPGQKAQLASSAQVHAQHSTVSRTEQSRASCKPRPEYTKGNGTSRAFVPWCSRGKR